MKTFQAVWMAVVIMGIGFLLFELGVNAGLFLMLLGLLGIGEAIRRKVLGIK